MRILFIISCIMYLFSIDNFLQRFFVFLLAFSSLFQFLLDPISLYLHHEHDLPLLDSISLYLHLDSIFHHWIPSLSVSTWTRSSTTGFLLALPPLGPDSSTTGYLLALSPLGPDLPLPVLPQSSSYSPLGLFITGTPHIYILLCLVNFVLN